jgi:hypothetical protein
MRSMSILMRCSMFLGAAALCSAASFTGKVVASTCAPDQPATCEVTDKTTSYGIRLSDGKILTFDAKGNAEVARLAKEDLAKVKAGQVVVEGDLDGETVKVTSVKLEQ